MSPARRYTSDSAAKIPATESAIFSLIAPNDPIVTPNCLRTLAYFTPSTKAALAPPTTFAPSLNRPTLRTLKAILCPLPISPSTFSTGTFASSRMSCVVDDPLMPSFLSSGPGDTPGNVLSTRNAVKRSRSTLANTVKRSAKPPFVMNCFVPLRM